MSRRFVLLDRDGTINEEVGYVLEPSALRLLPGAGEALGELSALGVGVVVLTNQSPVGRGWITAAELDAVHDRLRELLASYGVAVDGVYACPHAPDDGCRCRKPGLGLVERAVADHGFDPARAFVVGDHAGDVRLGRAIGATTILVRTGHGEEELEAGAGAYADHVVADLAEAVAVICDRVLSEVAS